MKNKISVLIGGLLVALLVLGVIGATSAYAQDSTSTLPHGRGPGGGRGLGLAGLQAAAEALDMTTDELIDALQSGKTLEELAEEAGVDLQDVQDAIQAVREQELRARIEQAVSDGTMTQEKADWLLEGLEKGFLDGPGFGFGFGHQGPRPDESPSTQPTETPSTSG
jgi:urease gamma subunit